MFDCDILTSTESSILSTDHHGRDLRVTQGSIHGLCNAMTHSRTKEKEQMGMLKSLFFIDLNGFVLMHLKTLSRTLCHYLCGRSCVTILFIKVFFTTFLTNVVHNNRKIYARLKKLLYFGLALIRTSTNGFENM